MGQGEPFANYDEVLKALRILNDPDGIGIGRSSPHCLYQWRYSRYSQICRHP